MQSYHHDPVRHVQTFIYILGLYQVFNTSNTTIRIFGCVCCYLNSMTTLSQLNRLHNVEWMILNGQLVTM
jgi:hypothetical protein